MYEVVAVLEKPRMLDSIHHGSVVELWALTQAFDFHCLIWSVLQPHIVESTTIPSQFRTFPCIVLGVQNIPLHSPWRDYARECSELAWDCRGFCNMWLQNWLLSAMDKSSAGGSRAGSVDCRKSISCLQSTKTVRELHI